jgi:tRNA(adenine34) deaminase
MALLNTPHPNLHIHFMSEALKEAKIAETKGEVPIGAVIVCQNRIIARAHNLTETLQDPTAHAEMQAITSATHAIGGKYLPDCTLYVTLEPCVMCAGALQWAQMGTIVFGASDPKRGYKTIHNNILHPKTEVISGILEDPCSKIVTRFFAEKRI